MSENEVRNGTITTKEIEPVIPKVIAKIEPKTGLYLVKPHAEMIMSGKKTLIVKSKRFTSHVKEPLFLLEGKLCWGIISLEEPKQITPDEFERLRPQHQISDEDAFKHWGWRKDGPLYAYNFSILEKYDPPRPVKIPQGVQVFVSAANLKWQKFKSLSILDLFDYADSPLPDELFSEVTEVMFDKNFFKTQVYELIRGWISDYDEKKPNDRQLGDDYRIVLGWYSSIKKGKKLFKRVSEEKKEITEEDCKTLGLKIFKEMISRGFTFNPPETYKKYSRELYNWMISQMGGIKNVPIKGNEESATTIPDPGKIGVKDLENVDDVYVSKLTDEQLINLHKRLHEIYHEYCRKKGEKI